MGHFTHPSLPGELHSYLARLTKSHLQSSILWQVVLLSEPLPKRGEGPIDWEEVDGLSFVHGAFFILKEEGKNKALQNEEVSNLFNLLLDNSSRLKLNKCISENKMCVYLPKLSSQRKNDKEKSNFFITSKSSHNQKQKHIDKKYTLLLLIIVCTYISCKALVKLTLVRKNRRHLSYISTN